MKRCSRCDEEKCLEEFAPTSEKHCRGGRRPECRACGRKSQKDYYERNKERLAANRKRYRSSEKGQETRRAYEKAHPEVATTASRKKVWRSYGLTPEDYQAMLERQGGLCAICFHTNGRKILSIDHDHRNGDVRGLLCDQCNWALGLLRDATPIIYNALEYLEYHQEIGRAKAEMLGLEYDSRPTGWRGTKPNS